MGRIVFGLLFLVSTVAFGQTKVKSFPSDSIAFFNEMEAFLRYSRDEEGEEVMDKFSWDWYGGKFSENQRKGVYEVANLMLKKKRRAFPDFREYLTSISRFVNSKYQTEASFNSWQEILIKLINGRSKKTFVDYLKSCNTLFEENILYKSAANTWVSNNNNYRFGFDSLPTIEFDALTLTCYSKGDSSVIYNTSGVFYPTERKWVGKGGKITWERAGFSPKKVYAEINDYTIAVKSPTFEAEGVTFYNTNYFDHPLKGRIKEKVLANVVAEKATYPRFDSYDKRLELKDISKGVDYIGGFSLQGRKVVGKGDKDQDAYVIIYREDVPFMKMAAKAFIIRPENIVSQLSTATIYIKQDSIFHPGLSFKLFIKERKVTLLRDGKGVKLSPYFNSYHQVDMDFEGFYWNLDDPMIEFKNLIGGTKTDANFVSTNFFKKNIYMSMMGLGTGNPLYSIKKLVDKLDRREIQMDELAEHTRLSFVQLESMLLDLSNKGHLFYDYENKSFIVKDKLINWVNASGGNIDYDVIGFFSDIKGESNATLSLINYDLKMRGVSSINVSDSQEVIIYPTNKEITVKKNRDFDFDGVVQAGQFDALGSDFSFKYDDFKIDMPNVDSLRIYAETPRIDAQGRPIIRKVKTVIEKINGELLIDGPNNKSGVKPYHKYPVLNSFNDSYVFYERGSIQRGAYKRDNFYFHLEPFTLDSLDNISNEAINFKGKFVSAGIFPEFEETLRLQPDHSLGFVRKTPPSGIEMYQGKGTFVNDIQMSHEGLKGDGKLEYITSTTYSNEFIFYPDHMDAVAQKFVVKESTEGVEFPPVEGVNVKTKWVPQEDYMTHAQIDKPIAMYDMESFMHGQTRIEPDGLSGKGIFEFEKAELEANLIKFKNQDFQSDTADFRLKDVESDSDQLSFATTNVNAYVSFKDRSGNFKSNGGGSYIDFPQNQYICFMDEFKWFMDNDDIELTASEREQTDQSGVKLDGAQFISVHPGQDSLTFFSTKAKYDVKRKIIDAKGVKFINVADAMVYPDSGAVVVEKNAKMKTLDNARVLASYVTQNHDIYNATINIFGRKKYAGEGYVDYLDEVNTTQTIYLENLGVDTTGQTYATGEIQQSENFKLSPFYHYYGDVHLFANNEYLFFDGYTKIMHDCDLLPLDWFSFETEINPNDIYIPIDSTKIKGLDNKPIIASVLLSPDSLGIYSAFLNKRKKYSHYDVLNASGYLYYDKEKTTYKISNKDKLQESSFAGNYLGLNTKNCKVYGEGRVDLGGKIGRVRMSSAGLIEHNQLDDEVIFDLGMIIDFFFTEEGLKKMAKQIQETPSLDPAKLGRSTFEKALREIIAKKEADKLIAQVNLYGSFKKVPEELKKTLVFSDIKLKWNDDSKSYKSFGKLGLAIIGGKQVNKYVQGKIELKKKRSGDALNIYLEIDKNNWYFFNYTRGIMQAISSNSEFNLAIQETKTAKRKLETSKKQEPYQFMYSTERKKKDFLRRFDN